MNKRKILTSIVSSIYVLSCFCLLLLSCKPKAENTLGVDENAIEKYVTCPEDTIDMIIATADSICTSAKKLSLRNLGFDVSYINPEVDSTYADVIPTITQIYSTYDDIFQLLTNEADAAFAWHEIAKCQMAKYYKKKEATANDIDSFLYVTDCVISCYAASTQYSINMCAMRRVMLSDFRLIASYKKLFDACDDSSLLPSIQKSYLNIFEMYRNRCSKVEGWWSDQDRELACMQIEMMDKRRKAIDNLLLKLKKGKISVDGVKNELDKRPVDTEKWNLSDF